METKIINVRISKGMVGRGNFVHYLYDGKRSICGAGKCSTGSRFSSWTQEIDEKVNCPKCLKVIERYRNSKPCGNTQFVYDIQE